MSLHLRIHSRTWLGPAAAALGTVALFACSSGKSSQPGRTTQAATCVTAGAATPGPTDSHCQLPDGGVTVQSTSQASCMVSPSGDDGGGGCRYGATEYGMASSDDDCKYDVSWTSTPICEQGSGAAPAPVIFTVTVTHKDDGTPLKGAGTQAEVFTTTPGDWDAGDYCDTLSKHVDDNNLFNAMTEGPPGTYVGPVYFDQPGQWTVRFHFFEVCLDGLADSPHGHAAFHITVP